MITFLLGSMRAHKVYDRAGTQDYDLYAGPFNVYTQPVPDLATLAALLEACPPNAYMVHGTTRGQTSIPYRRVKQHGLELPTLFDEPVHVVAVDYDGAQTEQMPEDIGEAGQLVRSRLPEPWCFQPCVAQATGSAWIKPGMRVRLWFLLAAPAQLEDIRGALQNVPNLDTSTLFAHQPVYVARPHGNLVPDRQRFAVLPATSSPSTYTPPAASALDLSGNQDPHAATDWCAHLVQEHKAGRSLHRAFLTMAGTLAAKGLQGAALFAAMRTLRDQAQVPKEDEALRKIVEDAADWTAPVAVPAPADKASAQNASKLVKKLKGMVKTTPDRWRELVPAFAGKLTEQDILHALEASLPLTHAVTLAHVQEACQTPVQPAPNALPWQAGLFRTEDDTIPVTPQNVLHVLKNHPEIGVWQHAHTKRVYWDRCPWDPKRNGLDVEDADDFHCAAWLNKVLWPLHAINDAMVYRALNAAATANTRDPWGDYLRSLRGTVQGESVLPMAAAYIFGAQDSLSCQLFRWWMISSVARSMKPGCKADYMLVLVGTQGLKKSSFTKALTFEQPTLCADFHAHAINNKDSALKLVGRVFAVMDDLSGMSRAEVTTVKNMITREEENERESYGRRSRYAPRTFVWLGSTNDVECLSDTTGGRRFWFIRCDAAINVDWVRANAAQLWAEAVLAFDSGERYYPDEEQEHAQLAQMQEDHRATSPIEDVLREVLNKRYEAVYGAAPAMQSKRYIPRAEHLDREGYPTRLPATDIMRMLEDEGFTKQSIKSLSSILHMLGWRARRSAQVRWWEHKDAQARGTYPTQAEQMQARRELS